MTQYLQLITLLLFISCYDYEHHKNNQYNRHKPPKTTFSKSKEITKPRTGYKVIKVKDGDTFVVLINNKEQTVRFAHIDCPEKTQPFGNKAKQFVSDMCFGTYVNLLYKEKNKYDRNKRLIAEVILEDGRNLNKELVRNGLAWHFKKYSNSKEYAQLEREARYNKIGIWSKSNPIAPWNWRKKRKQKKYQLKIMI